jgi:hypothetical protein
MREWMDEFSDYLNKRDEVLDPLTDLSEEIHQVALETDLLLEASSEMEWVFSSLMEKLDAAER